MVARAKRGLMGGRQSMKGSCLFMGVRYAFGRAVSLLIRRSIGRGICSPATSLSPCRRRVVHASSRAAVVPRVSQLATPTPSSHARLQASLGLRFSVFVCDSAICRDSESQEILDCHDSEFQGILNCHDSEFQGILNCHDSEFQGILNCHDSEFRF
jgi:hypothetical protein